MSKLTFLSFFGLLVFSTCQTPYKDLSEASAKRTQKHYLPTEKFENCEGYTRFVSYNCLEECVFEDLHCAGDGTGSYCAYTKCPEKPSDTLFYLEFKVNPNYQKTPPKLKGKWALDRKYYPFIADGKAYFAAGHYFRLQSVLPEVPVFIAADTAADRSVPMDERYFYSRYGFVEFWIYGEMHGQYDDGERNGTWVFNHYESNLGDDCYYEEKYRREVIDYQKGVKHGLAEEYVLTSQNDTSSWLQKPLRTYRYETGKLKHE